MNASEMAYRAAEYMAEHGHCKGAYSNEEGGVCFLGALGKVGKRSLTFHEVLGKAQELGYAALEDQGSLSVPKWNDAPERTGEDVILALKHVGAELEAEGK